MQDTVRWSKIKYGVRSIWQDLTYDLPANKSYIRSYTRSYDVLDKILAYILTTPCKIIRQEVPNSGKILIRYMYDHVRSVQDLLAGSAYQA